MPSTGVHFTKVLANCASKLANDTCCFREARMEQVMFERSQYTVAVNSDLGLQAGRTRLGRRSLPEAAAAGDYPVP
jgi:hypothetical protein